MKESDENTAELRSVCPPEALSAFISVFVCRKDRVDADVVRLLPELRSSVQVSLADPYWVREREDRAPWRRCPEIALWTPRTVWGYGHAKCDIKVYAFGLTPLGLKTLLRGTRVVEPNHVYDLSCDPELRYLRDDAGQCSFDDWCSITSDRLGRVFRDVDSVPAISDEALAVLSTDGGGAVAAASELMRLSTRQFRRRFAAAFGMSPKRYQKLARVDRMIRQLHPRAWESDAFAAMPVAFADQPHAIREFKEATGITPAAYVAKKAAGDLTLRSLTIESGVKSPVE
ncbi:MAG: AraC family transcriptional regulator [Pseudomonadota bacterium]